MKKIIALTAVIITVCLANLNAQNGAPVPPVVIESFNREFGYASNVRWTMIKWLSLARFENNQEPCIAYFDPNGELILSGRKISEDMLPLSVRKETERIRMKSEKGQDILAITEAYELSAHDGTNYFINLSGDLLKISLIAYGNGSSQILKRVKTKRVESATPVVSIKATR